MRKIPKLAVGLLTISGLLACHFGNALAKCPVRMGSLFPPDHFSVIARNGSSGKFPENTLPAFQEALDLDGANSLAMDLSLTLDRQVILWKYWTPIRKNSPENATPFEKFKPIGPSLEKEEWRKKISQLTLLEFKENYGYEDKTTHAEIEVQVPTLQNFMEWASQQSKLKWVLFKLSIPANESHLTPILLGEIRRVINSLSPAPRFKFLLLTPHKEVLNLAKDQFEEFLFSYDREIPSVEIINYHRYTTVPIAMQLNNSFASIGFPLKYLHSVQEKPDPWDIYKFILTLDFKIRDNFKKATNNYIKIISWTFDQEEKMRCLIHLGVDGIVTNNPKLLRKIALEMGKTLD
ncbi:MAG: hypothetical protein HOK41_10315 [Nitrospina sp.]|jgi:glycerophosphoryl diester phosphodiesterase|nr:hypothetical protein [Nitrospina sp.]